MDDTLALLAGVFTWFAGQPTPVQVIVCVGILAGLYLLLLLIRLLITAFYGAFRGL
jgi:hypothetical protein